MKGIGKKFASRCVILLLASAAAHASITYDVNFSADTETFTGYIALTALGPVTPGDISGWAFASVSGDPVTFAMNSLDSGAAVDCAASIQCGLTASSSKITFMPLPEKQPCCGPVSEIVFVGNNVLAIDGPGIAVQGPSPGVLLTANGVQGYALRVGTTLATVSAPELNPASALSGLTLLLGGLVVIRSKGTKPKHTRI